MRVRGASHRRGLSHALSERAASSTGGSRAAFADALREIEVSQAHQRAEAGIESIDRAAALLRNHPTRENLELFKGAIRDVLSALLQAYEVETLTGFSRLGKRTIHVLVRTVDQELDELARLVLSKAHDSLAIAAKIDDVRGLLLDFLR